MSVALPILLVVKGFERPGAEAASMWFCTKVGDGGTLGRPPPPPLRDYLLKQARLWRKEVGRAARLRRKEAVGERSLVVCPAALFVAVHMGAGFHAPANERAYRRAIRGACLATAAVLREGSGTSLDAVAAAIRVLEGEAKSGELIGNAIANNPAFMAPMQIEDATEIAHTIAASNNLGDCGRHVVVLLVLTLAVQ